jgi:hypothetical protein
MDDVKIWDNTFLANFNVYITGLSKDVLSSRLHD